VKEKMSTQKETDKKEKGTITASPSAVKEGIQVKLPPDGDFNKYILEEMTRIKEERLARFKAKGIVPFYMWHNGENRFYIEPQVPTVVEGKWGQRLAFKVRSKEDNEDYLLAINPDSPLYKDLLEEMRANHMNVTVVRLIEDGKIKYTLLR